jgi:hypothetical protein
MDRGYLRKLFLVFSFLCFGLVLPLKPSSAVSAQVDSLQPTPDTAVQTRLDPAYTSPALSPPNLAASIQGTLRTFSAVADTDVQESNPTVNYGIQPFMHVGYDDVFENTANARSLVRFNVTHFLPAGTVIHQATLQLYLAGYCDYGSSTYYAHRIADDWSELTATWNNQPAFAEGYGSANIPVVADAWATFDVTALAQAWANGAYPDHGIMIRGPEPAADCASRIFLTKGGGGFTVAPGLVVDYTLPPSTLSVSETDLTLYRQCGSGLSAAQSITLQSNSNTLHDWSATSSSGWLNLSKSNGKVSAIFPDQILVSAGEALPCPGKATAQIQISAPGLGGSLQIVNVTLQQSPELAIHVYLPAVTKNDAVASEDRIALVISIADYQHLNPPAIFSLLRAGVWGFDLLATHSDGHEIADRLRLDYPTVLLLSEEHATKAAILHALAWIDERENADTEVLLYFSGHGGPISDAPPPDEQDNNDELLGVFDTNDVPQFGNYISDDELKAQLANLETEHLAVIFDACNSGGMEIDNPHRAVLAASQENQNSWESSELEHGVFTYYLIQAMLNPASDTNGDGWLSVQEAYHYSLNPVAAYVSANTPEEQTLALTLTRDVRLARVSTTAFTE